MEHGEHEGRIKKSRKKTNINCLIIGDPAVGKSQVMICT